MGCYCSEISILKHDIGVIGSAISKLNSIKSDSDEILDCIVEAAENLENNIDITNKENVINLLSELSKDEPQNIAQSSSDWTSYKSQLQVKLENMIISDRNYHEEQRRKHSQKD